MADAHTYTCERCKAVCTLYRNAEFIVEIGWKISEDGKHIVCSRCVEELCFGQGEAAKEPREP